MRTIRSSLRRRRWLLRSALATPFALGIAAALTASALGGTSGPAAADAAREHQAANPQLRLTQVDRDGFIFPRRVSTVSAFCGRLGVAVAWGFQAFERNGARIAPVELVSALPIPSGRAANGWTLRVRNPLPGTTIRVRLSVVCARGARGLNIRGVRFPRGGVRRVNATLPPTVEFGEVTRTQRVPAALAADRPRVVSVTALCPPGARLLADVGFGAGGSSELVGVRPLVLRGRPGYRATFANRGGRAATATLAALCGRTAGLTASTRIRSGAVAAERESISLAARRRPQIHVEVGFADLSSAASVTDDLGIAQRLGPRASGRIPFLAPLVDGRIADDYALARRVLGPKAGFVSVARRGTNTLLSGSGLGGVRGYQAFLRTIGVDLVTGVRGLSGARTTTPGTPAPTPTLPGAPPAKPTTFSFQPRELGCPGGSLVGTALISTHRVIPQEATNVRATILQDGAPVSASSLCPGATVVETFEENPADAPGSGTGNKSARHSLRATTNGGAAPPSHTLVIRFDWDLSAP